MINFKQEELIKQLMDGIKKTFPDVELIDVMESWEDPETLWINVTSPGDEDTLIDLIEFAGDRLTDIFMEYGYHMLLMPVRKEAA